MAVARTPVIVIGAGPAGLTAAHELARNQVQSLVLESDSVPGGLARTVEYNGYLFDVGGHRFYTKVPLIERIWRQMLGPDFLTRPRLSRIYYRGRFFQYPLEPFNALRQLGLWEAFLCAVSYAKTRIFRVSPEPDFETWITNRFGRRLFDTFFKTYTEKVWGIPCSQIRAEWAAQRIRGLSLHSVVLHAFGIRGRNGALKTLINSFEYPSRGPGMMWQRMAHAVEFAGSGILYDSPVERVFWDGDRVTGVAAAGTRYTADHYISSISIRDLISSLEPSAPAPVREAAGQLSYRDFITVALIVAKRDVFPDNWIYIHEPRVSVGRIQNFKNWSPEMVPDPETSCLGLEYFCSEGDGLWSKSDEELRGLAAREIVALGLVAPHEIVDGTVLRMRKAYPVYDDRYESALRTVREFLVALPNLQVVGRNGMHRYNNQDHSMLTGLLAAQNVLGARHDLWTVNPDEGYLEDGPLLSDAELTALESTQPRVPKRLASAG